MAGVLGGLPGVVGLMQATEVIKLILGHGVQLIGRLLLYDAMKMSFREVKVRKDPECALCGINPSITELIDYEAFCNVPMPGEAPAVALINEAAYEVTPGELKSVIDGKEELVLLDVREPYEWDICRIEGAKLIPLSNFKPENTGLPLDAPIYLYCYKGVRSMQALREMKHAGYTNLKNLAGGIDRWALEVDEEMPRY